MALLMKVGITRPISMTLFWVLHPFHVLVSAHATTAMYRRHSRRRGIFATILVGYLGSVGIATVSDSLIPFAGEFLLHLPHSEAHLGFIEKWWLVNPLAGLGILLGCIRRSTKFPHTGHVLLSTWASLFHIMMAVGSVVSFLKLIVIGIFLFLAVWVPCCMSDIIFPLAFADKTED
jgi:hypothetical protein